jgi:CubicO group peptidase (beta-lactamase class C family)
LSDKETIKGKHGTELDRYLTRIAPFGFSGALLVAKNGKVVHNKGYGRAIREKDIRNTAETVFSVGSLTKQFTATAILRLEMQGRLNIHDYIGKYVGDVPADKEGITIHHLLTHTAGVINYTGGDYEIAYRDETIQKILDSPLLFSPGEHYEYSNAGYSLLAAIIEIASGQPYEEYLNENLFKPIGMAFTGYRIPNWDERVVANWYVGGTNNGKPLEKPYPYWNLLGNGGILSTTEDMYKWYLVLKDDSILSADARKKLFTPFLENYAYGWGVSKTESGILIQHGGASDLGSSADFRWFVDCDMVIILFCNQSYGQRPLISYVRDKIQKLAFGKSIALPPEIPKSDVAPSRRFEGIYKLSTGGYLEVSTEAGSLTLTTKGQDAINMVFLPEQDEALHYSDLNHAAVVLLKSAIRGNYSDLRRMVEDKKTMGRKRRFLSTLLNRLVSPKREIEVIGTFPHWREEDVMETVIQLKSKKKTTVLGLLWRKGKLWGFPTDADRPFMLLRPVSGSTFTGYHLGLAKTARVSFNVDNSGFTAGLTICGKKGNVIARRVEKSKEDHEDRNVS